MKFDGVPIEYMNKVFIGRYFVHVFCLFFFNGHTFKVNLFVQVRPLISLFKNILQSYGLMKTKGTNKIVSATNF